MAGNIQIWLSWWLALTMLGVAGWPWIRKLLATWPDQGYLIAKAAGLMMVSFIVWMLGSLKLVDFGFTEILIIIGAIGISGWWEIARKKVPVPWKEIIIGELVFSLAWLFWSWIKSHEPAINGLEKFMDYGFTSSILRSRFFPPADMWFAGEPINYYYFGHLMMAVLTKLARIDLAYGFNLMLGTIFAWCLTISWSIGRKILAKEKKSVAIVGACLIAYLVTLSGNLHTIYAFTKGYWNEENPPPFWKIMDPLKGFDSYWYPNATRFIPYTIHEFPSYSFVVSDLHGHVLSIPIVLFLIALLVCLVTEKPGKDNYPIWAVYGWAAGIAFMTNALDGPIYLALFGLTQIVLNIKNQKSKIKNTMIPIIIAGGVFLVSILPFLTSFKPFVNGIAVNCPPALLANTKIGPLIFEGIEKCQRSPIWMLLVLWGFFLINGVAAVWLAKPDEEYKKIFGWWAIFCAGLILFAEGFYFKDIYPMHFRSNTMFKLGYQAFIIMSIISGYSIIKILTSRSGKTARKVFLIMIIPLIALVSIYPYFSVKSYFNSLKTYQGIYGLNWLKEKYPGDYAAVNWLNQNVRGQSVILEATGDSYTDYERISTFTGMPTVAGWIVHEWLWRGSYEIIAQRAAEVKTIFEATDINQAKVLIDKYNIKYIIVGKLEREKYQNLNISLISALGKPVFTQDDTVIYRID